MSGQGFIMTMGCMAVRIADDSGYSNAKMGNIGAKSVTGRQN